ncbi:hypothetical protein FGIG_02001 [Fasciola gigantica]|uniref:Vitellogenin domain-containing protein n=1 Tax=Fasciola gigantica TaxID=46835 RepID=A0A504YJU5_FASGI|nr:hypothetical protein FGIG_02001 [Fasciola gigantica]
MRNTGGETVVRKSKARTPLAFSNDREEPGGSQLHSGASRIYSILKQSQKIPHLDGSLVCSQIIELDVGLLNSTCDEIIVIARNGNSMDKTVVHVQTALRRLKRDDTVSTGDMTGFSGSIEPTFDLKNYYSQMKKAVSGEKSKFVQLVREVYLTNSPRSMYKAIRQSRLLSYSEQTALMDEILAEDHADIRKVYAGILVETGTVATFKFLRDNAEKLGLTSSDILSALKKISYPDADLLQIMIELLRDDEVTGAALPVSGAVQTFCHQHPHCQDYEELTQIVDLITETIGTHCTYTDKEQMNQVIIALRALGNMGRLLQSRLATILSSCLENPKVDVSVQVTAIEALRLTDCSQQLDNIMIQHMADQLRDIELRIFAYRSYMRCPMEHKLPKILNLLQNESSQQFGSYVYSHLTNLASLVGPIAEPWTDIIGPFEKRIAQFRRKFALNRRSFSKHYGSFYRFKNVGVHMETSVIFGPESPLPRHVSVNLTIDLFDGQLQFLEFGIRSTEQSQLWKNLLKPTVSAVSVPLDALEKLIRKQQNLEKMTTAFLRIGAQDQWYTPDLKKTIYDLLALSKSSESNLIKSELLVNNMIVIDSSLFIPTIGGFPIEINYLALKTSRKGSANRIYFAPGEGQVNWTSSSHLSFGTQLKVAGFQHRSTINQWWSLSFDANLHGAVRYTRQADHKEGRIYLENWDNDQLALKYKYDHYAILDDAVVPNSINSPQMTLLSETPTYVGTLLGVKATSKKHLTDELPEQEDYNSVIHHTVFADVPLLEKSSIILTHSFLADYSQNGILHATGNLSSTPWQIYGVYTESDERQRFTARIQYPTGTLTLTFRGNLTGNFKLQIHNADSSWPEPLELTQRVINSRHTYYPSFKRFHHDTRLRLRDDQVLSLQLEWNSGRRNGRLEQGVIRAKQTNKQNCSELQSALTWTEGDATSRLDQTVSGYSRQLRVETKVVQHDNNPLTFSVGMDQFFSKNIWMIHTDLPAIISFNAWSYSPDMPSLQLNYSTACTYRYRLDQGGSFEAFSVLNIPSANIDALAKADLQWKSIRKAGVSWIQDLSGSVTLRIFPPENDRYFRVNISPVESAVVRQGGGLDHQQVALLTKAFDHAGSINSSSQRRPAALANKAQQQVVGNIGPSS